MCTMIIYGSLINLINDEFVDQLRRDVEIMIMNLSQSSKGQTVARARVPKPTLNIPIVNPLAPPRQRTRAATYVSPSMAIEDKPPSPPQKRDATRIEGIEDLEVSPKSKAKAAPSSATAEADSTELTMEERAKAETALNDFVKYETKKIEDYDITFLEDYISYIINNAEGVQK